MPIVLIQDWLVFKGLTDTLIYCACASWLLRVCHKRKIWMNRLRPFKKAILSAAPLPYLWWQTHQTMPVSRCHTRVNLLRVSTRGTFSQRDLLSNPITRTNVGNACLCKQQTCYVRTLRFFGWNFQLCFDSTVTDGLFRHIQTPAKG